MENLRKFYIDGRWQDPISTETMSVLNPATEMQEGIVALGNDEDVNKAVAAAKKSF
jgi:aldehyde dehydrogenase (NAD+)